MPIDPSIALQVKAPQFESPLNALGNVLQLKNAQQQNQLGQMQLTQQQTGIDRTNRLNALLGGFKPDASPDDQVGQLTRGGFLPEARTLAESSAKVAKEKREADKFQLESQLKKFEVSAQIMSGVKDQASWERARQLAAQAFGPEAAAQMPAQYDPALIEENMAKAMSVKDQIEQQWKAKGYDLDVKKFNETKRNNLATDATSRANNANSVGATIRGQNMTDARARDTLESGRNQIVQTDNGPVLVNTRTGAGKIVNGPDGQPLPGVTKPLNDGQSKALLFGTRMQEADKVLGGLAKEGTTTSVPGSRTPVIGGVINAMSSDNKQMLDQAKRDFMTAVLRRESGAAISSGEFDNADKQYFPQVGDSQKVIEQKARNRQLAIQGVLVEVPEKQRKSITPAPAAGPNIDDLVNKYK